VLRTVLERTRGDLTLAIRQEQMRTALQSFETRLDAVLGTQLAERDATYQLGGPADLESEES
jgi:hypothetical protein